MEECKVYCYGITITEDDFNTGRSRVIKSGESMTAEVAVGYIGADGTVQSRDMTMDEFIKLFGFDRIAEA